MRPCSLGSLQGTILLCLFELLVTLGIPWLLAASLQSLLPSSHGLTPCVSLMRTPVIGFRIHPESRMSLDHYYIHISYLEIHFQMRSHSDVAGWDLDISFGEILFDPLYPESIVESGCEGWCKRIIHTNTLFCAEQSGRCILPTPSSVYWRRGVGRCQCHCSIPPSNCNDN